MNSITPLELKSKIDSGEDIQIIDVREQHEADICSIGGELIPMGSVIAEVDKIRKEGTVVVHCRSGKRSAAVINALSTQFGYNNLLNLEGGILQYADDVDNSLERY